MKDKIERNTFIPLGSVVVLQEGAKKIMIIARGIAAERNGEIEYFEYGGCMYPEGLVGEQILYFNKENVGEIVKEGLMDEESESMSENIGEWIKKTNYKKGNPYEWNTKE